MSYFVAGSFKDITYKKFAVVDEKTNKFFFVSMRDLLRLRDSGNIVDGLYNRDLQSSISSKWVDCDITSAFNIESKVVGANKCILSVSRKGTCFGEVLIQNTKYKYIHRVFCTPLDTEDLGAVLKITVLLETGYYTDGKQSEVSLLLDLRSKTLKLYENEYPVLEYKTRGTNFYVVDVYKSKTKGTLVAVMDVEDYSVEWYLYSALCSLLASNPSVEIYGVELIPNTKSWEFKLRPAITAKILVSNLDCFVSVYANDSQLTSHIHLDLCKAIESNGSLPNKFWVLSMCYVGGTKLRFSVKACFVTATHYICEFDICTKELILVDIIPACKWSLISKSLNRNLDFKTVHYRW